MGILSGNPKDEPLHYGEVFSIWEASMMAKEAFHVTKRLCIMLGTRS